MLTVYVPVLPVPVPSAVITVLGSIDASVILSPTAIVPLATAVTVSVVVDIDPVNTPEAVI